MSLFNKGPGAYKLYDSVHKKRNILGTAVHKDPTPIFSADSLLNTEKRQQALNDIRSLLSLPDEEFDRFFKTVTENFAEFVQNLPETERSYYAGIGGMLDHALERAALSLFLCRTYLLPADATLASVSQEEMLWVYAVFTAALLLDVGKIATTHVITLTDQAGQTIKHWLPFAGSMTQESASHYVYGFSETHHDHMRWMVTPLLARQILPKEGFEWIASDNEVFESWLALLSDEQRQVGSLLTVIRLADAQLLESFFTDKKIFRHNLSPQTVALLSKLQKDRKEMQKMLKELREKMLAEQADKANQKTDNLDTTTEKNKTTKQSLFGFPSISQQDREGKTIIQHDAKEITKQFLNWIQDKVEKKAVSVNKSDSFLHTTQEGVVIDQKLLQQFIAENKVKQLSSNELKQLLTDSQIGKSVDYVNAVQVAVQTGQVNTALLVENPYLIMPSGGVAPISAYVTIIQAQPVVEHKIIQTAQEAYAEKVAIDKMHDMRPTFTPTKH